MKLFKYLIAFPATLLLAFGLFACGDDETVIETHTSTGYDLIPDGSFASDYDCDDSHLGRLLYSESFKTVYLCDGEVWQVINGKDGIDGKNGTDGKNGKDGKDGKNGKDGNICSVVDNVDRLEFNCNGDTSTIMFDWKIDDGCSFASVSDSLITIVCDSIKVDVPNALDGKNGVDCSLLDNGDGTYKQVCGDSVFEFRKTLARADESLAHAMCGGRIYNDELDTCIAEKVYSHCADTLITRGGTAYCIRDTVYAMCNGMYLYNIKSQLCKDDGVYSYCGDKLYRPKYALCRDGVVYGDD